MARGDFLFGMLARVSMGILRWAASAGRNKLARTLTTVARGTWRCLAQQTFTRRAGTPIADPRPESSMPAHERGKAEATALHPRARGHRNGREWSWPDATARARRVRRGPRSGATRGEAGKSA